MSFNKANEKVHLVETQWHYAVLIKYGFKPLTYQAVGFVRSYDYVNESGRKIVCNTGLNADYWEDKQTKKVGYHSGLESFLKSIL